MAEGAWGQRWGELGEAPKHNQYCLQLTLMRPMLYAKPHAGASSALSIPPSQQPREVILFTPHFAGKKPEAQ